MPKLGTTAGLTAADVWAAATRTLTGFAAGSIFDIPKISTSYPSQQIDSSVTPDTFGSWVELVANVGAASRIIALSYTVQGTVGGSFEIEVGSGAAGAESAITRAGGLTNVGGGGSSTQVPVVVPLFVGLAANARISARMKSSNGTTPLKVSVMYV